MTPLKSYRVQATDDNQLSLDFMQVSAKSPKEAAIKSLRLFKMAENDKFSIAVARPDCLNHKNGMPKCVFMYDICITQRGLATATGI